MLRKCLGGGGRPAATLTCPFALHPSPCCLPSYGRVYAAADPYHHTLGPAATYSIGTMVRRPGGLALGPAGTRRVPCYGWGGQAGPRENHPDLRLGPRA